MTIATVQKLKRETEKEIIGVVMNTETKKTKRGCFYPRLGS